MKIKPARRLRGTLSFPGDKSISHRAAIIAALARGRSRISNFSSSSDCASTISSLRKLGVRIEQDGKNITVTGAGIGRLSEPSGVLDCGNSGSTLRMLAGVVAGHNFKTTLTGDDSLRSRPMQRIIEPLELMGARICSEGARPPLCVEGHRPLAPIDFKLPISSAQVKTCLLLAGLHAEGKTEVSEHAFMSRDHTERMLQWFGVPVAISKEKGVRSCAVNGPATFDAADVRVPGDFSTAAFFLAAAALLPGSDLTIEQVGLNPTRIGFLQTLQSLGASIEVANAREDCNEPVGTIHVGGARTTPAISAIVISGELTASMIDELPLLAVVGTQTQATLEIKDAGELRFKESDRITATVSNLRAMGAEVEELEDGLRVSGSRQLKAARLDSFGDHRIVMAFSVAALLAEGESEIMGADCVAASSPKFYEALQAVVEQ